MYHPVKQEKYKNTARRKNVLAEILNTFRIISIVLDLLVHPKQYMLYKGC